MHYSNRKLTVVLTFIILAIIKVFNPSVLIANSNVTIGNNDFLVNIVDFSVIDGVVWSINQKGVIYRYNYQLKAIDIVKDIDTKRPIVSMCALSRDVINVVNEIGVVFKYNVQDNTPQEIFSSGRHVLKIIAIESRLYGVNEIGIIDFEDNKIYPFENHLNPETIVMNAKDIRKCKISLAADINKSIWIGFDYGEWGGELYTFNTKTHQFEDVKLLPKVIEFQNHGRHFMFPIISFIPIKSIFTIESGSIYIAAGMTHFGYNGFVFKFNVKDNKYFGRSIYSSSKLLGTDPEYIGSATYNKYDNHIYLFTHNGIKYLSEHGENDYRTTFWAFPDTLYQDIANGKLFLSSAIIKMDFLESNILVFLNDKNELHLFRR